MGKGSFIIYDTDLKSVRLLNEYQAGRLFLAISSYRLEGEEPNLDDDLALKILYQQLIDHISINEKKYKETCERRSESAKKRWLEKDANACNSMQMHATLCINDNDNVNDNDNDNVNVNVNVNENENVACGAKKKTKENYYNKKNNIPNLLRDDPAYDIEAFERKVVGLKYQKKDNAQI